MSTHHAPAPNRRGSDRTRSRTADPNGADAYDHWDDDVYDDEVYDDVAAPRVLWGRVAVFGAVLLLAFLAGRATAGNDAAAVAAAEERIAELSSDLEQARAELDAVRAGGTTGEPAEGADAADPGAEGSTAVGEADSAASDESGPADPDQAADSPAEAAGPEAAAADVDGDTTTAAADEGEAAADPPADPQPEGERYTVTAGDHLFGLAEQFYGDGQQWRLIAEANDLPAGAVLDTGQELLIPPAP